MRSKWIATCSLSIVSACLTLLPACGQRDPASSNRHDVGTLTLGLATTSQGRTYRLRQASFDISGPTHAVLDGEQDPDATALTTQLEPGSYQISLNGPWVLERLDATGPVRLTASLISDNPLPAEVSSNVTSHVTFRFATDGTMVSLGDGTLSISTEVVDTRAGKLPPGLTALAGQPSGFGFADGVGAGARFSSAAGPATTDGKGNLFVNDGGAVRQIALASAEVTTLATYSNAQGWCVGGLAAIAGDLYFANRCESTIRRVALDTREVTLVAGSPGQPGTLDGTGSAARFDFPGGLATDGKGNLYVSTSHVLRKLVLATAEVTTLAGSLDGSGSLDGIGSDARFESPSDLTFNSDGNLYVADGGAIRKVDPTSGQVSTLVGGPSTLALVTDGMGSAARFSSLSQIAGDDRGNLYVPDFATLRKVVIATAQVTTFAGLAGDYRFADGVGSDARFGGGSGIAHFDGRLYVVDGGNAVIRKLSLDSNVVSTIAGAPRRSGNQDGVAAAVTFDHPQAAVSDGQGSLYVLDSATYTIRKIIVANGVTTTLAGELYERGSVDGIGSAARFVKPWDMTLGGDGNLYLVDATDSTIRKIVPNTGEVSTFAGKSRVDGTWNGVGVDAAFDNPTCITSDGADNLYVVDRFADEIRRISISSRQVTTAWVTPRGAPDLRGLASDHDGALYFNVGAGRIQKLVLETGELLPVAGSDQLGFADGVGESARFQSTSDIAFDGAGCLYVIDAGNLVRKIELATGAVTTVVGVPGQFRGVLTGSLPARLNSPAGLAVLPGGLAILDEGAVLTAGF